MNTQLALEFVEGIGVAIGIGSAFFIIPFGLILLGRMLPWFIWGYLFKSDSIRNSSKMSDYPLNDSRYNKKVYIDNCHPAQVIKRFKSDGLPSLFRDYNSTERPVQQPDAFGNKQTPIDFLKGANPIPINDKLNNGIDGSFHADNLAQGKDNVNQKGTLPTFPSALLTMCSACEKYFKYSCITSDCGRLKVLKVRRKNLLSFVGN